MAESYEDKIQKIELDTIKAVTEMRGDIKSLTSTITELKNSINRMTENYVTKEDHLRDIGELEKKLVEAKQSGRVRSILVGIFTTIITAVLVYEITNLFQGG